MTEKEELAKTIQLLEEKAKEMSTTNGAILSILVAILEIEKARAKKEGLM